MPTSITQRGLHTPNTTFEIIIIQAQMTFNSCLVYFNLNSTRKWNIYSLIKLYKRETYPMGCMSMGKRKIDAIIIPTTAFQIESEIKDHSQHKSSELLNPAISVGLGTPNSVLNCSLGVLCLNSNLKFVNCNHCLFVPVFQWFPAQGLQRPHLLL